MLKRIEHFEIKPYEKRNLQFIFIATQLESFINTIDLLLQKNYLLSQIKIMYNPKAKYANVYHRNDNKSTFVVWKMMDPSDKNIYQENKNICSVGEIIKSRVITQ